MIPEGKHIKLWIHITAGEGPAECQLFVSKVVTLVQKELQDKASIKIIEKILGQEINTYKSMLLAITGNAHIQEQLKSWEGTLQWSCPSPYRPLHKRKNWFIGLKIMEPLNSPNLTIKESDIQWQAVKSSGPGGQHVNTTDSAVQAIHLPTGIRVYAQEERSQHRNKKRALLKIRDILIQQTAEKASYLEQLKWLTHKDLERGNPIKIFIGRDLQERTR